MACVLHARDRAIFADRIGSVGKQARDESGKYPVNENDEEIIARSMRERDSSRAAITAGPAIAESLVLSDILTPAQNENARDQPGHNVVSVDSERSNYAWLATVLPSAACAAARRAIGTR